METQIQVPQSIEHKQKNQKLIRDSNNDIHTQSPILNRWLDPSQATLKGIIEENDESSQSIRYISNSGIYKFNEKLKIVPKSQNDKDDPFSLPKNTVKHHDSIPDSQEDIKNTNFANTQHIDRGDLDEGDIEIEEDKEEVNDELNEIVSSYEDKIDSYKSSGMKTDSKLSQSQVISEITGDTQTPKSQNIVSGSSSDQKCSGDTLRIRDSNELLKGPGTSNIFSNHDTQKLSKTENDEDDDQINFNNRHKRGQAKIIYSQIQISETQVINNGQDAGIPDTLAIVKSSGETIPIDIEESQSVLQVSGSFFNSEHEDDNDKDSDEDDFTKDARILTTTRSLELIEDEKNMNRDTIEHQDGSQDGNKDDNTFC
ncbi:unnamed protein product [[Candida] boidinii]|nr:unnamed protein product [[Candida] boidinii]